jgi:hypothetical protein
LQWGNALRALRISAGGVPLPVQQPGHLRRVQRPAEQIALRQLGTEVPEQLGLPNGLDALRDDRQVKRPCEVEDRRGEVRLATALGQRTDEASVDLDLVDRQLVQVAERGVPGAEVVERQPDPDGL